MQIYFDNAATTFPKPDNVNDAVNDCMRGFAVNSGRGIYDVAQKADKIIAETRTKVGNTFNANAISVEHSAFAFI